MSPPRAVLPATMRALMPARADGLGAGTPSPAQTATAAALALTIENCSLTRIDHIDGPGQGRRMG